MIGPHRWQDYPLDPDLGLLLLDIAPEPLAVGLGSSQIVLLGTARRAMRSNISTASG